MASSPLSRMPFSAKFPPAFRSCIAAPKPSLGSLSPVFTGGSQVRCVSVQMSSVQQKQTIKRDGKYWTILEIVSQSQGRGGATLKARMEDMGTGKILSDVSFRPVESVDLVELTYRTVNLLYNTKDTVHLIDPENGEEFEVEMTSFMGGEKALGFYDESTPLTIIQSDAEEVVRAQGPQIVVVEVKEVDESKGSMGSEHRQTTRNATLVSGAQVLVPSFIKPGDKVKCSVEDRRFISRA